MKTGVSRWPFYVPLFCSHSCETDKKKPTHLVQTVHTRYKPNHLHRSLHYALSPLPSWGRVPGLVRASGSPSAGGAARRCSLAGSTTPCHWCRSWRKVKTPGSAAGSQATTDTRTRINGGRWHLWQPYKTTASLTWSPEEPALGWMVRPRVTPPFSAFFRLSFTSVISSSRLTRSSSFSLHSSSTFFSRSDSEAWERLPCGGSRRE